MLKEVDLKFATRLINHGPVVLVISHSKENTMNITPVAWCMPLAKNPPRIVIEVGRNHFIRECIETTGDFALNIVSSEYVKDIVYCGSVSGKEENKLDNCRFSAAPCKRISSGRIAEDIAVLECKKVDDEALDRHKLILGDVVSAEAEEEVFKEFWQFGDDKRRTVHHLGGRNFCVPEPGIL